MPLRRNKDSQKRSRCGKETNQPPMIAARTTEAPAPTKMV
jgi:hypothetical protein